MRNNTPVTDRQLTLSEKTRLMSVTTPESHITYANKDFIDVSGYSTDELMGQPHNLIRHRICHQPPSRICGKRCVRAISGQE